MTSLEASVPDIPEGVTLYTELEKEDVYPIPPELFVVYEDDNEKRIFGGTLEFHDALYRNSYNVMVLRKVIEDLYAAIEVQGMWKFRQDMMAWTRTLA